MALSKGERPLLPKKVGAGDTAAAISQTGRLLVFPLAELKQMPKGRGLIVQDIGPKDEMVAVAVGDGTSFTVGGAGRGGKAAEFKVGAKDMAVYRGARARKGQPLPTKLKPTGLA